MSAAIQKKRAERVPTVTRLRTVAWCNLWNVIAANDGDGYGTKCHLTEAEGVTGRTLCGKPFPDYKGHPSVFDYCRRCVNAAYKRGYEKGFTRGLRGVPSAGSL